MQYLLIPLLIILAIGAATSRLDLPGFDFPNVLSILGWGTSTPSSQGQEGSYFQQDTQPTNSLLDTFITEGPENNTKLLNGTTVTFKFSGQGPQGSSSSALLFETKIEGFDGSWQASSEQKRTAALPGGIKTYRFLVRSKLGNEVDATPASRTFTVRVSPYFGKISITNVQTPSSSQGGRVSLSGYSASAESISVTGWKLQGKTDDFIIPRGVKIYLPAGPNPTEDIRMGNNVSVVIAETANPLVQGMTFRPNQCFGYFAATRTFLISVPSSCPDFPVQRSSIAYLSPTCQDYILQLPYCKKPNYSGNSVAGDLECRDFLDTHLSYETCVQGYKNTSSFLSNEWHVYTESERFMRPSHDQILLYDSNNLLVASYDY